MENSGVVHMVRNRRVTDLACMYSVLCRVSDGLATLAECVSSHLRDQGKALVSEEDGKTAIIFVQVMIIKSQTEIRLYLPFFDRLIWNHTNVSLWANRQKEDGKTAIIFVQVFFYVYF